MVSRTNAANPSALVKPLNLSLGRSTNTWDRIVEHRDWPNCKESFFLGPIDENRISSFPEARADWTCSEKSELRRLQAAYPSPRYEIEHGSTDDGDPWCVVSDGTLDSIIIHIARIGHTYAVVLPERGVSTTAVQIKKAIDLVIQQRP
jgi:hypothetical protein